MAIKRLEKKEANTSVVKGEKNMAENTKSGTTVKLESNLPEKFAKTKAKAEAKTKTEAKAKAEAKAETKSKTKIEKAEGLPAETITALIKGLSAMTAEQKRDVAVALGLATPAPKATLEGNAKARRRAANNEELAETKAPESNPLPSGTYGIIKRNKKMNGIEIYVADPKVYTLSPEDREKLKSLGYKYTKNCEHPHYWAKFSKERYELTCMTFASLFRTSDAKLKTESSVKRSVQYAEEHPAAKTGKAKTTKAAKTKTSKSKAKTAQPALDADIPF